MYVYEYTCTPLERQIGKEKWEGKKQDPHYYNFCYYRHLLIKKFITYLLCRLNRGWYLLLVVYF